MAVRSVDFLPEIFQTPVNRQFLTGTLDQLVQEPNFTTAQGYIGRRIGPGVNANDDYIVEPNVERANYQLEPGIVITNADRQVAKDVITYPGILDALAVQGADTFRADRLFTSEYYAWDAFVDFDKMVNFAEYYWLPAGPFAVTVQGSQIPYQRNIQVTRNINNYTFDFQSAQPNPTLTLVRGGSYNFLVNQNQVNTFTFRVSNRGSNAYLIDFQPNPNLTLVRGNTYNFTLSLGGDFPFYIKTIASTGKTNLYNKGVTNNGAVQGTVSFTVPYDAPDQLFYAAETSETMRGNFDIIDPVPGTGPKFWIQTSPGITGTVPGNPNISSRNVLGVVNNGEDLGTVTFNVPSKTAQNFYYSLAQLPDVDLVSTLPFAAINNQYLDQFLLDNPDGIDGITDLNNRTIVFVDQDIVNDADDASFYGWYRSQFYSPNPDNTGVGEPGTYDEDGYSTNTPIIAKTERYQIYEIKYESAVDGTIYLSLQPSLAVENFEKFNIISGISYSGTKWFKNSDGYFEAIPLLSAALDVLYYQDGDNPAMFGEIRLVDQAQDNTIFIEDIIGKKYYTSPNGVVFTNGLKVLFSGDIRPTNYLGNSYYVEGVGTAIKLLPVVDFITPETYTESSILPFDSLPYDIGNYDVDQNQPARQDYLTINRASADQNAWCRSNRWFHRTVIEQTAVYTNTTALLDQNLRAKRPILEFRAGIRMFDFGSKAIAPVNIIDFSTTDAFSLVAGQTQYNIDGYALVDGSRVIFANDTNPEVRNRVYQVVLITPDTTPPLIAQPVINLVPTSDSIPLPGDTTVCIGGLSLQGISFWFDGVNWLRAQQKISVNQAPLFDVFDISGFSLSNLEKYPGSSFIGSKLFSYALGSGANDIVLDFPLQYLTISNVGDIVFDNNLYTDTFLYVINRVSVEEHISIGTVRQYADRTNYESLLGWQTAATPTLSYQQFRFNYNGDPLLLDVAVTTVPLASSAAESVPNLKVYVSSKFISPDLYEVTVTNNTTSIRLLETYVINDVIEVLAYSNQVSEVGFYEIPINLQNNPLNTNSPNFTLGTVRTHYNSICQNLTRLVGSINGSNNSRDLGNIIPYGSTIVQQSSPLTLSGLFLRQPSFDLFSSIDFNNQEYTKYKNVFLDTLARNDYSNMTTAEILTAAISEITLGKTSNNAFYYSDMLPASATFVSNSYTFTAISTPVFETIQTYNFTSSNYLGLNVFVNNRLLTRGYDYNVIANSSSLEISSQLSVGDVVVIQEFSSTLGNFCPNTPTKLGLYPAWRPEIYLDNNYVEPQRIILGHDGSKTVAFGDFRDEVLLEFETRIFNNLKIVSPIPIPPEEIIPGAFRTTDWSQQSVQEIFSAEFLAWIGWNKLDYTRQDYIQSNPFTWNYDQAGNKLNGAVLPGAWRGIYLDFYDTVSPNTTPWEMLGITQKPTWWDDRYGPAPYTSGNLVLWEDLEAGLVADPQGFFYKPEFARPGLTKIIPVGPNGELLSPFESVVGAYDPSGFRHSWQTGDYGPVEYSWRASSAYPFAVMKLVSLCQPAKFFSLNADRDLYVYNTEYQQYLYNNRYRLDANTIQIYGTGVSKASFINWIVDYNAYLGNLQAPTTVAKLLQSLDVRLCYRLAAFSSKQYLKLFLEKPTPASSNTSLLLPDNGYDLLLYKNQPFDAVSYSSVIVQKIDNGYQVFGYSTAEPYFQILVSRPSGILQEISGGGSTVRVPSQYTTDVARIPYGYTFVNDTVMVDFLLSYGKFLQSRGFSFGTVENGREINWDQMAVEFLYWSNQGWGPGSLINLNPSALELSVQRANAIVDNITLLGPENQIQDQNKQVINNQSLIVERFENEFRARTQNNQAISFVNLKFTSYEHVIVLRNVSAFGDLIYQPATGARQNRIKFYGNITNDWNGQVNAPGFILNQDNIEEWVPNRKYTKGEIVLFKNNYWSALTIVQPKEKFDFNDWAASDRQQIQLGLLPNIPNKANQLANSYNINQANLESDNDLLSYGLIGFRPRQYMAALDLDDVSQVNVYKQFLGSKGTISSVRLLANANFDKEAADYTVYENWAILTGVYGAQANRSFIDLRLNQALLTANPSLVQLIEPDQKSLADQAIELANVWSTSTVLTSTNFLPTVIANGRQDAFPSAGYVNLDDVDITVFSIDDPSDLNQYLDQIGVGTSIWVAKTNSYEWNIYRGADVPGQVSIVSDNLDGTSTVGFTDQHRLSVGDIIIIKFFDDTINGVYRVISVPSLTTVTIVFSFTSPNQITATGVGLALRLQTMRVSQASDAVNLPYVNEILPGALIWVDNDGTGRWTVLQKNTPIQSLSSLFPNNLEAAATKFGNSVSQTTDNNIILIGQPNQANDPGAVINYQLIEVGEYTQGVSCNLRNTLNLKNYGWSVTIGTTTYAASGAPNSESLRGFAGVLEYDPISQGFFESQILLPQAAGIGEFGYAVAMSKDERWLYVGAPGDNLVYAYGKVDVQTQSLTYKPVANEQTFSLGDIQFSNVNQLVVVYNGAVLNNIKDYVVTGSTLNLTFFPAIDSTLSVSRRVSAQLDKQNFFGLAANIATGIGVAATFNIEIIRGEFFGFVNNAGFNYSIGDVLTINGTQFGGTTPADNCVITVTNVDNAGAITAFTTAGTFILDSSLTDIFNVATYLYSATDIYSVTVVVDSEMYRPFIDYNISGGILNFSRSPALGAQIIVEGGSYWQLCNTITDAAVGASGRFGAALITGTDGRQIIVGSPNDTVSAKSLAGRVSVFDRYVEKIQVTNTNIVTYTPSQPLVTPTSVYLNGVLQNSTLYFNNGTYTTDGTSITFVVDLNVGDIIEIETNQFTKIQDIDSDQVEERSNFGFAVELCPNNCSLYIGAPLSSQTKPQAGSVERSVNQSKVFGTITNTIQNPVCTAGHTLRINNLEIAVPAAATASLRLRAFAAAISSSTLNAVADVSNGYITIQCKNQNAATPFDQLTVLPGSVGTLFADLGFETFVYAQTISSPYPQDYAQFGYALNIDDTATILTVGAPNATLILPTTFDSNTTTFDSLSTTFSDYVPQSGVVYTFNYLSAANPDVQNLGSFIFGQEIYDDKVSELDEFGISLNYRNNILLVGSPGKEKEDSTVDVLGRVALFDNPNYKPAWQPIHVQQATVDVHLLNSVSMYDRLVSTTNQFFDFFDPLQGKILGAAERNLDFTGAVDPAVYNTGSSQAGNTWFETHEGEIWWDTTNVRFIDPGAGDIVYAAKRWAQVFPGSRIDVYQWIKSFELPANYTGIGTPYALDKYSVSTELNNQGVVQNVYYYWVRNITSVATFRAKTLSTETIARYIENPKASGISYVAPVSPSTIAIMNGLRYIKASDTILHIEYDQTANDDNVHTVYDLIPEGKVDGVLPLRLYQKLVDSLSGINAIGLPVPNVNLPYAMRYGVAFSPRQSMFINRLLAGQNFISFTNKVLQSVPISELNISFALLNSAEPIPSSLSGQWNFEVADIEELSWQNIQIQPVGYKYLVLSDVTNFGFWTIYTVTLSRDGITKVLLLTKVQNYDTRQFWNYVDWYASTYNSSILPITEVPLYANLAALSVPLGSYVKVTDNGQGKWEIYQNVVTGWERVGLQDGTIEISTELFDYTNKIGFGAEVFDAQYFDYTPEIETRKVVEAVYQDIFINDLAIYRNRLITLMFDYVLSEQTAVNWLGKTSLIDVVHKIRQLLPFQNYRRDNQDFVLDYINEVKPYHVQIRQFNLQYDGDDLFQGDITDFDLPAFFDNSLVPAQYVSPILDYDNTQLNNPSAFPANAAVWEQWPYSQWIDSYLLSLNELVIVEPGSGYIFAPTITVTGSAVRLATVQARINDAGQISSLVIVDPGEGYLTTPVINITGGSGSGAVITPIMTHQGVRTFSVTLKYDRYQYQQTFVPWEPNVTYDNGTLVSFDNRIWEANSSDSSGVNTPEFELTDWIFIAPGELSGVDRTMGYYVPNPTVPGKVLPMLIDGVEYPGVIIQPVPFDAATGFGSDLYDFYPFDNIQNSPEGGFTYSDEILDTIFTSSYVDSYLGTRPSDINVEGGAYVDTYSSYAPEELVPGSEFDTLDLKVFTRPGSDWTLDGHGFPEGNIRFEYTTDNPSFSFLGVLRYPITIQVTNVTKRLDLPSTAAYIVDWTQQIVTILNNPFFVSNNDLIMIRVFELGGGNQLFSNTYLGDTVGNQLVVDVAYAEVQQIVPWINGSYYSGATFESIAGMPNKTLIKLGTTLDGSDFLSLTVLGESPGTEVRSWSAPVVQEFVIVDNNVIIYNLDNSLQGSNVSELIVSRQGRRLRPNSDIEYISDGSTEYFLPTRNVDSQEYIANNDVTVYVDDVRQNYGSDFLLSPWVGTQNRFISFAQQPSIGQRVLISVSTYAEYTISGDQLVFRLSSSFNLAVGDIITVTTWNDTSQQNIITKFWYGSQQVGVGITQPFDSTPYSSGDTAFEPGSFDFTSSTITNVNNFDLARANVDPTRLFVYYNGFRLVNGIGFTVSYADGTSFLDLPFVIGTNDSVAVTMTTDNVVPAAMAFRVFQDMRGLQLVYRITENTTTTLAQPALYDDDILYLDNASAVGEPNVAKNVWGIVTINAERIMYRTRDTVNNTISGLLRGTAGTAAAPHASGSIVYDMSRGNLLPMAYQNYIVSQVFYGNGTQTQYEITNFNLLNIDSTLLAEESVRVFVGGRQLLISEYMVVNEEPLTILLYQAVPVGVEVVFAVYRGDGWYQPGINTPSDGEPLQLTNTEAARFLRGL